MQGELVKVKKGATIFTLEFHGQGRGKKGVEKQEVMVQSVAQRDRVVVCACADGESVWWHGNCGFVMVTDVVNVTQGEGLRKIGRPSKVA